MKYLPLFILIQLVSLVLTIIGWPLLAFFIFVWHSMPKWTWIWQNDDDAWFMFEANTRWGAYKWLALRNPVANLRHVPGVSKAGRPLWYWSNGTHYAKAGWLSNGYPCLSAGAGKW